MCLRYFLVLLKHCQHERAYTSKITKNKKGGGHQSAPNVPDCLIELFPDIGIDKQESARLSIIVRVVFIAGALTRVSEQLSIHGVG